MSKGFMSELKDFISGTNFKITDENPEYINKHGRDASYIHFHNKSAIFKVRHLGELFQITSTVFIPGGAIRHQQLRNSERDVCDYIEKDAVWRNYQIRSGQVMRLSKPGDFKGTGIKF